MTLSLRRHTVRTRSRRASALAAAATAGGLALALAVATPAVAHNAIVSATPEEGEVLTSVPEVFEVITNEVMLDLGGDAAGFGMLVTDEAGLYYGDGCLTVEGEGMSMPATLGAPGDYTFTFQYVSADGHTLSGEYDFSYAPEGEQLFSDGSAEPPVCGEAGAEPSEPAAPSEPSAPAEPTDEATDEGTGEPSPSAEPAPGEMDASSDAAALSPAVIIALAVAALAAVIAVVFAVRRRGRADDAA